MRKPKKPPVKAKGGGKGGAGAGGKGGGHHKVHGWKSGHKGVVPHHPVSHHHAHHPQPPAKKPKPPVKRKWSPGWDVACCSAEAAGLLLGWGWDEVLALYWRTASDPDAGATIEDTLLAAAGSLPIRIGSGKAFPYGIADTCVRGLILGGGATILATLEAAKSVWPRADYGEPGIANQADAASRRYRGTSLILGALEEASLNGHDHRPRPVIPGTVEFAGASWPSRIGHGLILGVTLPEPHAIAVTPDGTWWSWGHPFNPAAWPELTIEETWLLCAG